MRQIFVIAARDFTGLHDGRVIRAPRRREYTHNDRLISRLQQDLREERITLLEFMRRGANFFEPLQGPRDAEEFLHLQQVLSNFCKYRILFKFN